MKVRKLLAAASLPLFSSHRNLPSLRKSIPSTRRNPSTGGQETGWPDQAGARRRDQGVDGEEGRPPATTAGSKSRILFSKRPSS
ncbi:MAG: hypothetical protein LC796_14870 [Acidobacteria bacterium]|nr:hypothetical protein [Acidobacteriota bacterium]MCA1609522.1 hypothetical protein [Acidobacteriota bacterium]